MTLDDLLTQLKALKYNCKVFGETEQLNVIQSSEFYQVENLIRQFALDNHDEQIGVLKAKVYTYEQVISKSTFAPLFNFEEEEQMREKINRAVKAINQDMAAHSGTGEEAIQAYCDGLKKALGYLENIGEIKGE